MQSEEYTNLEQLGYDGFFEAERKTAGLGTYPLARVTAEYKEAYRIIDGEYHQYFAKVTGKLMYSAVHREAYPAVGDWVAFERLPENEAIIRGILSRKTILKKKYSNKQDNQIIATNIDTAFIVQSVGRDFNLNRYERFLVLAREAKIIPVFVINKIDLVTHEHLKLLMSRISSRFSDIKGIATHTKTDEGIRELKDCITNGKTYCFLGSSGVGKSSLINKLLGKDEIKTRKISLANQKGTHTTTTRDLYFMEHGGILIDNPGTREVGISDSEGGISDVFDDIEEIALRCKFSDCTHTNEPGCAIKEALEHNRLDTDKYRNYVKLKKESRYYEMTHLEKREKDRKFGKYVKKVLQELEH